MKISLYTGSWKRSEIILLGILYLFMVFMIPQSGHWYDNYCWEMWATEIYKNGISKVYNGSVDYTPLYLYVLYVFDLFQNSVDDIHKNIYYLKAITLVFDFLGALLILKYTIANKNKLNFVLLTLLNIAYIYNTLIWGQVDAIFSFLLFLSVYFFLHNKTRWGLVLYLLAINFKPQAIIFLPILGLLYLPVRFKNIKPVEILLDLFSIAIVQLIILCPFIMAGELQKIWGVIQTSVGRYPFISLNAFNFWHLLPIDGDIRWIKDDVKFLSISYKNWGLLLFFLSSFFALLKLLKSSWDKIRNKTSLHFSNNDIDVVLLIGALIPILFFFFNTQMHERYFHPSLLFLFAYAYRSEKYAALIIGSLAYFLNLEKVMEYLHLNNYGTLIFNPRFIAALYLILIILLAKELYAKNKSKEETRI